jgi:hypothetical protein
MEVIEVCKEKEAEFARNNCPSIAMASSHVLHDELLYCTELYTKLPIDDVMMSQDLEFSIVNGPSLSVPHVLQPSTLTDLTEKSTFR